MKKSLKAKVVKLIKKLSKMSIKNFLNLFLKKCTDTKVLNLRITSKPNPYVYNLQWDSFGTGNEYILNVKLPNGMFWNINVVGTSYQLVINDPDGRHEIRVKKRCSCSTESVASDAIIINPCNVFTSNGASGTEAGTGFHLLQDWVTKCVNCAMSPVVLTNFVKTNEPYEIDGILYGNRTRFSIDIERLAGFQMISGSINIIPIAGQIFGMNNEPITPIQSGDYPKVLNATLFNNVNGFQNITWTATGLNSSLVDDNHCVAQWDIVGKMNGQVVPLKGCKILGEIIGQVDYQNLDVFLFNSRTTSAGIQVGDLLSLVPPQLSATNPVFNSIYINGVMSSTPNTNINYTVNSKIFDVNDVVLLEQYTFVNVIGGWSTNQIALDTYVSTPQSNKIIIEVTDNVTGESETLTYIK